MTLTEKEREMLEKERDDIKKLTLEILRLQNNPANNSEIKEKVIGIQFSINRIASYSKSKKTNLPMYRRMADGILSFLSSNPSEEMERDLKEQLRSPEIISKLSEEGLMVHINAKDSAWRALIVRLLNRYCCYANSIDFDFSSKRALKIVFPKITLPKYLNIGNIINFDKNNS